ncbi:MAG: restriction endonuclease subunit S [Methylotenera sp.]|nr:restriction endonuclease subunit S [Methylotenera sp.]MDO9234196.1 restriction endonuclease subunit S [Methylotenera sp.]
MSAIQQLITEHMDIWTAADTGKRSGRGRASGNAGSVYGVKKLRELILELAVRGKLVAQDANDEPACELLKRIQAEKAKLVAEGKIKKDKPLAPIGDDEKPFELPQGWIFVRLREIATHLGDGLHGTPIYTANGEYYFVNGNNLKDGKIVIKHETKTVDVSEYEKHKKPLNASSILVSINGTLGSVGFYDREPIILGKSACYINLVQEKVSKYFVKILIDAPSFMEYALKNAAGTTIKNLGLKAINYLPIALPPCSEQHRIVTKVDELMSLCDQLKTRVSQANQQQQTIADVLVAQAVE